MSSTRPGKMMLFGIDSAPPELTLRFVEEGALPNIAKYIKKGVFFDNALPPYPTLTPTNWTSIVTGATPGTHGITDFMVHHPGEPLDSVHLGFNSDENSAEYIWNSAARAGKRSILVKYTASWPPKLDNGVQIDGCVPNCGHHICRDHYFEWKGVPSEKSSDEDDSSTEEIRSDIMAWDQQKKEGLYDKPDSFLLKKAGNWAKSKDALEGKLIFKGFSGDTSSLYILIEKSAGKLYDKIRIFSARNLSTEITELSEGGWSGWIPVSFADTPEKSGKTICKCMCLAHDGTELRLYFTAIMPKTGYSSPPEIALELAENIPGAFIQGPPVNAHEAKWIDPHTFCEVVDMQADWYIAASIYLLKKEKWDMYFIQTHAVDHAQHIWLNKADPHTSASKEESELFMGYLRRVYQAADRILGAVTKACADENTLVVIISDHGAKCWEIPIMEDHLYERAHPAREILKKAGLSVMKKDPVTGNEVYDWTKTKAAAVRDCFVYVNLKGRDPDGIVEPGEEYNRVVEQAITALRSYIDPKLGLTPFSLVLKREDARILGHYNDLSGDIIYAVDSRYAYTHGQQLPSCGLGIGSMRALLVMAGPMLRKNIRLKRNVSLIDIAPTICHLMEVPVPKDCEGAIIYQAIENPDILL